MRNISVLVFLLVILIGCASTSAEIIPTAIAETPKEIIPELSVEVIKPDEKLLVDALEPFSNAFQLTPEQSEKVKQGMQYVELKDKDGKTFFAAVTPDVPETKDFNEAGTPLLMAAQKEGGEWEWEETTLKKLLAPLNMLIGVNSGYFLSTWNSDLPKMKDIVEGQFNILSIAGDIRWDRVEFQQGEIKYLRNGENNGKQNVYTDASGYVEFAKENNMVEIGGDQINWNQYPVWLLNGNFSKEELKTIMQQHIKKPWQISQKLKPGS